MNRKTPRWIAVALAVVLPAGTLARAGEPAPRPTRGAAMAKAASGRAQKPKTKKRPLPHIKMTARDWRRLKNAQDWTRDHTVTAVEITALAVSVPVAGYFWLTGRFDPTDPSWSPPSTAPPSHKAR